MVNSRFSVAIHVLCLLATEKRPLTSSYIAGSVNTNPVVIRRVLSEFRKAELVKSLSGVGGGWELIADPQAISLGRIYQLLRPGSVFALHSKEPNQRCPVGKNIQRGLKTQYEKAQAALESQLNRTTIADMLSEVIGKEP